MTVGAKDVIKYAAFPRIIPRIGHLFSGFSNLALFIAYIFNSVGLIPNTHPYLLVENKGRYGIRHVIAEAANSLKFDIKHIDQITIFCLIIVSIVLILMQITLLGYSLFISPAFAGPGMTAAWIGRFFGQNPAAYNSNLDIANILMELVWGLPGGAAVPGFPGVNGFFDTCVSNLIPCFANPVPYFAAFPSPYHSAMNVLFEYYNLGILVFGLAVFLYLIVVIVTETAKDGTPFGRRFNGFWAPVRFIFALALMMPVDPTVGYSWGQIMTMRIAWAGSNLASNAWTEYTLALDPAYNLAGDIGLLQLGLGPYDTGIVNAGAPNMHMIATPNAPELNQLLDFYHVARTCYWAERKLNNRLIGAYVVETGKRPLELVPNTTGPLITQVFPNGAGSGAATILLSTGLGGAAFTDAHIYSGYSDITIRFGELDPTTTPDATVPMVLGGYTGVAAAPGTGTTYPDEKGYVYPYCGEVIVPVEDIYTQGSLLTATTYFDLQKVFWVDEEISDFGNQITERLLPVSDKSPTAPLPLPGYFQYKMDWIKQIMNDAITAGIIAIQLDPLGDYSRGVVQYGWAGAGMYYNRIAEMNSGFYGSVQNIPYPNLFPDVMEFVKHRRNESDDFVTELSKYNPYLSDGQLVEFRTANEKFTAISLYHSQQLWFGTYEVPHNNAIIDSMSAILGIEGIYNVLNNNSIHPLAQIVAIGRSLTTNATALLVGGGVSTLIAKFAGDASLVGDMANTVGGFMKTIGMMALALGFILNYVIPMLPFIYFFFAVGGWIKGVFEAMVGLPLFALAHLRIDGNGLPGPVAMGGYWLLFELFLRPTLIVVGLIAGVLIFSAQVNILHEIWYLVMSNLSGFDPATSVAGGPMNTGDITYLRDEVTQFFSTLMYVILIYLLGMGSFKLIDNIPNYILRWMNAGVSTFGEQTQNPGEMLVRNTYQGTQMATNQLGAGFAGIFGQNK